MRFGRSDSSESLDQRVVDFRHSKSDDEFVVVDAFVGSALDVPRVDDVFLQRLVDGRIGGGVAWRKRIRYAVHRNVRHIGGGRDDGDGCWDGETRGSEICTRNGEPVDERIAEAILRQVQKSHIHEYKHEQINTKEEQNKQKHTLA